MEHGSFRGRATFVGFLLFIWVGATVLTARATPDTAPAAPDWVFECAACPHNFYDLGPRSAQIDAAGMTHVVYGGEALYHAWQSETGWQVEVVEDRLGVGSQAGLVIDGDGTLHIFYLDEAAQSLRHASGTIGAWTLETVATDIGDQPWPSPAVTADGQLHVAFRNGVQDELVHAQRDSSGWQLSTVDAYGGEHPSLGLDAEGRPHLSYIVDYDVWTGGELRYAYDDGSWQVEAVRANVRISDSALALDSTGKVHLVYGAWATDPDGYSGMGLMYAYLDQSGWHHEVADATPADEYGSTSGIGYDLSLALDSGDRPHVAYTAHYLGWTYYPSSFYLPRHATREAGGWSVRFLPEYRNSVELALAMDGDRQPHLIYRTDGDLIHQLYTGTWQHETVDPGGMAGIGASMALDARGRAHITSTDSYVNSPSIPLDGIRYSQRTVEGWQSGLVAQTTQPNTALALDPYGYPHTLRNGFARYTTEFALYHDYRDAAGWHSEPVSGNMFFGEDSPIFDLAVSGDSQVHAVWARGVAYGNWLGGPLYYVQLPRVDTVEPELISSGDVRHMSLATDTAQNPHVAYSVAGSILYAYRDEAGWQEEVATSNIYGVDEVALALDGHRRPHIAFYAAYSRNLYYARRDDTGWHVQLVDATGDVGQYPAIAVSSDGNVHISYFDATNQDLKYALRTRSGETGWFWSTEILASEGDVGLYTSIALYGYPHISYYDATRGDLMYVYKPFIPVAFSHLPLVAR
ncbi:MAG: hypothetical protein RRC07_11420 [Anaerolineae bacterium]|nr:hypothetical protein [Anaerolineae bacterium]